MIHERTPEEYPVNLGLTRPEVVRADFDKDPIIKQALACHAQTGRVTLIAFWGVGWKRATTNIDRLGVSHLGLVVAHLQKSLLKGISVTLLISDVHAWANEVPLDSVEDYVRDMESLAKEYSFQTVRISSFLGHTPDSVRDLSPTGEELAVYEGLRNAFERSARRLCPENSERRALNYFLVRFRERQAIANAFPLAIFANSDTRQRGILTPPLPHFFIYAMPTKRWRRHKPWFIKF